jgi:hypothetical protein
MIFSIKVFYSILPFGALCVVGRNLTIVALGKTGDLNSSIVTE